MVIVISLMQYRMKMSLRPADMKHFNDKQEYILGVRPTTEMSIFTEQRNEDSTRVKVLVYEPQADHAIVTVLLRGQKVVIESSTSTQLTSDTEVFIEFNVKKLRLFDPASSRLVLQIGYEG